MLQTSLLLMKSLNKTETSIFLIRTVFFVSKGNLLTFIGKEVLVDVDCGCRLVESLLTSGASVIWFQDVTCVRVDYAMLTHVQRCQSIFLPQAFECLPTKISGHSGHASRNLLSLVSRGRNGAACLCTFSSLLISSGLVGSQAGAVYSNVGRTSEV